VARVAERVVEQHDREGAGDVSIEQRGVDVGRHDQQAVHAPAHRAHGGGDLGGIAVHAGQEELEVPLARDRVDAADDLGEELAVEIGQEDADGVGAMSDEAARAAVGHVAQRAHGGQHAGAGLLADVLVFVHHARHRGDGHAGLARDILDARVGAASAGGSMMTYSDHVNVFSHRLPHSVCAAQ